MTATAAEARAAKASVIAYARAWVASCRAFRDDGHEDATLGRLIDAAIDAELRQSRERIARLEAALLDIVGTDWDASTSTDRARCIARSALNDSANPKGSGTR